MSQLLNHHNHHLHHPSRWGQGAGSAASPRSSGLGQGQGGGHLLPLCHREDRKEQYVGSMRKESGLLYLWPVFVSRTSNNRLVLQVVVATGQSAQLPCPHCRDLHALRPPLGRGLDARAQVGAVSGGGQGLVADHVEGRRIRSRSRKRSRSRSMSRRRRRRRRRKRKRKT